MIERDVAAVLGQRFDDRMEDLDAGSARRMEEPLRIGDRRRSEPLEVIVFFIEFGMLPIEPWRAEDGLQVDEEDGGFLSFVRRVAGEGRRLHDLALILLRE